MLTGLTFWAVFKIGFAFAAGAGAFAAGAGAFSIIALIIAGILGAMLGN